MVKSNKFLIVFKRIGKKVPFLNAIYKCHIIIISYYIIL